MTRHKRTDHIFITYYGTFIDTPKFGEIRIRYNTAIGVCMKPIDRTQTHGTIRFIIENCSDPYIATLEFDETLTENDITIIKSSDPRKTCFFFPGFIDTHIHASQYPNCGIIGDDSTLLDWLNTYTFPTESALKHLPFASQVYSKIVASTLRNGTTTASYFTTIDLESTKLMAKICSEMGQRAMIGKVCMDQNSPDYYIESYKDSVLSLLEFISYINNDLCSSLVKAIATPRFAPSCSSGLMYAIGEIAQKENLHIQTHLSENSNEIKWVKELFPECENYTDVYRQNRLLSRKTILAHAVHLSREEIDIVKETQSGISHCPISNTTLTSGECPVKQMYLDGIHKIGLGTDVSAGYSCSILESARAAYAVSRHLSIKKNNPICKLTVKECLYLATMGGAKVLDMEHTIGSFEIDKQFDCQEIDLQSSQSKIDFFDWQLSTNPSVAKKEPQLDVQLSEFDSNEILSKWFFNGDDRNVVNVWVDGINTSIV